MNQNVLSKETIKTIDPIIKQLVILVNRLSFVKKTRFSCSGNFEFAGMLNKGILHKEEGVGAPYITVEYQKGFTKVKNQFNAELLADPKIHMRDVAKYWSGDLKDASYSIKLPEVKIKVSAEEYLARLNLTGKARELQLSLWAAEKYSKLPPIVELTLFPQ